MDLKSVILFIILTEVAAENFVRGLQCYVCEDCNEYDDFKELHICGEIPIEITMKPFTLPGSSTKRPSTSKKPNVGSSPKPIQIASTDDYLYEDSAEKHDTTTSQTSNQKSTTTDVLITTTAATETTETATQKPLKVATASLATNGPNVTTDRKTTTRPVITTSRANLAKTSSTEGDTTTTTAVATTTKPVADYDDYLEYEDLSKADTRAKSLLKINEPVCYMIKYYVNNTVFTKRGCTTFINSNKYLTCKSLYNGGPMDTCRICSSNGCNKFRNDVGHEDNLKNGANIPKHFGVFILLLWVTLNRAII